MRVRVVPRGVGAYPAMGSPFTLLGFPHRQHNDVVYLETFIKSEYGESLDLIAEAASLADPAYQPVVGTR